MKKIFLLSLFWILSLIIVSIYTFENPETMEEVKQVIKSLKKDKAKIETGNIRNVIANAFLDSSKVDGGGTKDPFPA